MMVWGSWCHKFLRNYGIYEDILRPFGLAITHTRDNIPTTFSPTLSPAFSNIPATFDPTFTLIVVNSLIALGAT